MREFSTLAIMRRPRPDIGPGAYDEIALATLPPRRSTDVRPNDAIIVGRSSARGRMGWGKVGEIARNDDPRRAFELHAARWGYTEVQQTKEESR